MENNLMKNKLLSLHECAKAYYSKGIITIPIDLVSYKPLIDSEFLTNNEISYHSLEKMFEGLNYEEHGIAIPVKSQFGYFEGIRLYGNNTEINTMLEEILLLINKECPDLIQQIGLIINENGADIYFGTPMEGITGKILAEKIDVNGTRIKFIEFIGKDGFIIVPPTKGYLQHNEHRFPSSIQVDNRNLLIRVLKLFNIPHHYYMETMNYGKKENLANIVVEFHYHKESEHIIRTKLLNELKWLKVSGNIWKKRNKDGKIVYAFLNREKKDMFWVSDTIDFFEPNVIYQPFDFLVFKLNGDYMKALEEICSTMGKNTISQLRQYKQTIKDLNDSYVSMYDEFTPPEPYIYIEENNEKYIIGSIHNLSVLSGKAKVGKTLLLNELTSSAFKEERIFHFSEFLTDKKIVYFDTEQSQNHSCMINERIIRTSKQEKEYLISRFELYNITGLDFDNRIKVIEEKLHSDPDIAVLIIDGIVDLVLNYNNPDEVSKLMTKLLKWKDEKPVHIMVVIHENKGNSLLRGHLGTELMNKSETVIGVSKNQNIIKIKSKASRNKEFEPKLFKIIEGGFLEPFTGFSGSEVRNSIENFTTEEHYELLAMIFEGFEEMQYENLRINLKESLFVEYEIQIGDNKVKKLITRYVNDGLLHKVKRGVYSLESELSGSSFQNENEKTT